LKLISELDIGDRTRLKLQSGEYKQEPRIDLRLYVKNGNEYIPTRKGINFNAEWLPDFVKMIKKLEKE